MKLDHTFEIQATPERAMAVMLDGERVIPCMPGAELDRKVDDRNWKSTMTVALGPVKMHFVADVHIDQIDEQAGRARLNFSARDTRGMGGAQGSSAAEFTPTGDGRTRVNLATDVSFSGRAAQLGRPNVVNDVSQALVERFARCLQVQLTGSPEEAERAQSHAPLSGAAVMGAAVKGMAGRILGRDKHDDDGDEPPREGST